MFILIDKRTLILKNVGKRNFSYETKASVSFIRMSKMTLRGLIMKGKGIISEFMFILIEREPWFLKMVGKNAFIIKLKHKCHLSQWRERVYGTQSWK